MTTAESNISQGAVETNTAPHNKERKGLP